MTLAMMIDFFLPKNDELAQLRRKWYAVDAHGIPLMKPNTPKDVLARIQELEVLEK